MPLSGKGMLVNFMDVDPAVEQDFNRWYDKEHVAERVAIPGFLEARRYVAQPAPSESAPPKYLALYTTETFETLTSPAYRQALQNQTEWSMRHIPNFRNPTRALVRITASRGQGRGGALAFLRLRPAEGSEDGLRAAIMERLPKVADRDGVISAHLLESDAELSKPLVRPEAAPPGAGDWYVLVDGTDPEAVRRAAEEAFGPQALPPGGKVVLFAVYRLLWDLSKAELER